MKVVAASPPRVEIRFSARRNARGADHGWVPSVTVNGRETLSTYAAIGYDRDTALRMAHAFAYDECSRWIGDWAVSVAPANGGLR